MTNPSLDSPKNRWHSVKQHGKLHPVGQLGLLVRSSDWYMLVAITDFEPRFGLVVPSVCPFNWQIMKTINHLLSLPSTPSELRKSKMFDHLFLAIRNVMHMTSDHLSQLRCDQSLPLWALSWLAILSPFAICFVPVWVFYIYMSIRQNCVNSCLVFGWVCWFSNL